MRAHFEQNNPGKFFILVCPEFFLGKKTSDGQAEIVRSVAAQLEEILDRKMRLVALRQEGFADRQQAAIALNTGFLEPTSKTGGSEDVVSPPKNLYSLNNLASAAVKLAAVAAELSQKEFPKPQEVPVFAFGFESGLAVGVLAKRGHPVIGGLHYLFAEALLFELGRRLGFEGWPVFYRHPKLVGFGLNWFSKLAGNYVIERILTRLTVLRAVAVLAKSESQFLQYSKKILTIGNEFPRIVSKYYPDDKKLKVGNTNKLIPYRPGYRRISVNQNGLSPPSHGRVRLLAAGRPAPQKGWDYIARALRIIEQNSPIIAAQLEFVGLSNLIEDRSSYAKKAMREFNKLSLIELKLEAHVPREELLRWLKSTDIFLLPSRFEPFGLIIIEALDCGCHVIATDCDGPKETLAGGVGTLIPRFPLAQVPQKLAGAIVQVASQALQGDRKRLEPPSNLDAEYSWEKVAKKFAAALNMP